MNKSVLPSMRVDGQIALVTGAGRGIGKACAVALAEAGADLVLMSRTDSELDEVAMRIEAIGRSAQKIVCDVSDASAVSHAIGQIDRLDILINNAGILRASSLNDLSAEDLDDMLRINCRGTVLVAQAAAKIMTQQRSGVIVNMSSTFGVNGRANNSVYSATKHFVEGFTKSTAVELAPLGIRVVAIGPTAIETPLTHGRLNDPAIGGDLLARIPMGRFGQVEDVVGAVVFLSSPAAALISGTTLMVDGGWSAQ